MRITHKSYTTNEPCLVSVLSRTALAALAALFRQATLDFWLDGDHRNGYQGVMIPDHTPQMTCAAPWHAGMAYALGYMRAAIRLVQEGA